jgi:hypothetical protein
MARAGVSLCSLAVVLAACAGARSQTDLEPRYVAVHNTLVAMGLAETGPIQQASIAEGRDAKLKLDLPLGCTTVVVLGGPGVKDVHASVEDAQGNSIAKDSGTGPEAAVRACVPAAGAYVLAVKMQRGGGDIVCATWSGGAASSAHEPVVIAATTRESALPQGTCQAPTPLSAGATMGNTSRGEGENQGSCSGGSSDSKEIVYRLDLTSRERVRLEVEPRGNFDPIIYLRQGDCADTDSEIACNDDLKGASAHGGSQHPPSRLDQVLEPGTYFVFVDGYGSSDGAYKLTAEIEDIPSVADICARARPLSSVQVTGATQGSFDHARASCGDEAKGADSVYKLDVGQRERVRITEHSDDFPPVIHLRSACADDHTELSCSDSSVEANDAAYTGVLEPGTYAVFADSSDADADGHFTLDLETSSEAGTGTQGDACGDATLLPLTNRTVEGDTFAAKDDISARCSAQGAPDVVYRVELPRKLRVSAAFSAQEGDHVMSLQRSCGDKATEIACATDIDEVLPAGTYFLSVDGKTPHDFGKFKLDWKVRDVALQEAACARTPTLTAGQTVTGNTKNGSNKFQTSCGGRPDQQNSPDAVYKLVAPTRQHVRIELGTPQHDGVVSIRKACTDAPHASNSGDLQCNMRADDTHHTRLDLMLEPGAYYVIVDGHGAMQSGPFTLSYHVVVK